MSNPSGQTYPPDFWEQHYAKMTTPSGGRPSTALVRFIADRTPGTALELGCARGDDTIWLAKQGWSATGVDVAEAALVAARQAAERADVADRTTFERHEIGTSLPRGTFDLVFAMFLHSPVPFERKDALRHAAASVAKGGLLLLVTHGSRAPWSWAEPGTIYPSAEEELAELALPPSDWSRLQVGPLTRLANGPGGQTATVVDNVIALERT